MQIHLDHYSTQARDDRRAFLDLVAAAIGDRDVYLKELERLLNEMFRDGSPPERTAYLLDAAVQVARTTFTAWSTVVGATQQDVMHVLESEWPMELDE
jgi:hypothetical protein